MSKETRRRDFLKMGIGAAVLAGCEGDGVPLFVRAGGSSAEKIPLRVLGRTGEKVTLLGLGGQGALQQTQSRDVSLAIIERALALGVTYFDTAPLYGPSRDYLGEGLAGKRDGIFLASKTHDRTRDGTAGIIDDTLARLRTDRLDLLQIHNVMAASDLDTIFGPGGAMEAIERAVTDGRVRYVGITGHFDPELLAEGLRRYPFDAVLMAFNAADSYRRPVAESLLPLAVERNLGIIAMKVLGCGALINGDDAIDVKSALDWVWSHPVSLAIIGMEDPAHVDAAVAHAKAFVPVGVEAMKALESRVAPIAARAAYFKRQA